MTQMHIITRKRLLDFSEKYPNSETPLDTWYRIVKKTTILNFSELREIFPSADKVGDLIVFNISGNNVKLITAIHFNTQLVYIRHVLTHNEYDKGKWKE